MKNSTLQIFNKVDLHDSVLSAFNFDFENQKMKITFELYDDLNEKYVPIDYEFYKISKFLSKYPEELSFKPSGCYSASCKQIEENKYEAVFLLEFHPANVVWEVIINFENIKITGGLSKEAEEYSNKIFNKAINV